MCDYEMVRRSRGRFLTGIAVAAVGLLIAFASAAAAIAPSRVGPPVRKWSVSKIEQGVGRVPLDPLTGQSIPFSPSRKGDLSEVFDLGPAAFNLRQSLVNFHAAGWVASTGDGGIAFVMAQAPVWNPFEPRSAKGGVAHLDQYQAYEKPKNAAGDASLRVAITHVLLEMVDENGPLTPSECPLGTAPLKVVGVVSPSPCASLRSVVRFRVRAYPKAGGRDFFDTGGVVYAEGHEHDWNMGAATLPDSRRPFFPGAAFQINRDLDGNGSQRRFELEKGTFDELTLKVPLRAVDPGQQFVVKVSLDAEAVDDRGHESSVSAFIQDPQHATGVIARGLISRRVPKVKEPPIEPRPAARCPAGPSRQAGTVQLSDPAFSVGEASGTALVLVTRRGVSDGATSVVVKTSGDTARSGQDFTPTRTLVRFENGDTSPRLVEVPIREDLARESPESFKVSLSDIRCAKLGKQRSASVTILDDDQPPPPPPPSFTIGGTVDGLQGSGLVLTNFGASAAVSANGSFTFPGTVSGGQQYEVRVNTQPSNPDQVCTVENGSGQVSNANVTTIVVHCAAVAAPGGGTTPTAPGATPSGLDTTFGGTGRVTTPGSGEGRAVLIQPDGGIVTVGPREAGTTFRFEFGATRHDAAGQLDPSFGTGGVASTSLGGNDDKAFDAALMPDGGFVAVGQADPAGLANIDFGVVRYTADGHPDPGFNGTGVETTDITGRDDAARAVAVQPDGKIIAAGTASTSLINFDFALVRYNPDGTLDKSFDGDGIVTTELGANGDGADAMALQPDGKIVVAGVTDENVALARYLPDGKLDPTFNGSGTVVSNVGTFVPTGVAITPGGTILVSGTRDFGHGNDVIVASFASNGELDTGFGQGGVAHADLSGQDDFGNGLVLDPHGNIVVVGTSGEPCSSPTCSATSPTPGGPDMALVRFSPDGTLDTSFANHGILTADFQGHDDQGNDVAIDPQGRIIAAGTSNGQFALVRANP